jgi:monothiol glutaredoxin
LSTSVKEEFKNVGEFIDKVVKENDVVLFIKGTPSAPQCGFSRNVVKILQLQGKRS